MVCYVDGKVCCGGRGVRSRDRSWDGGVSIGFSWHCGWWPTGILWGSATPMLGHIIRRIAE